jgi:hypothetical protein
MAIRRIRCNLQGGGEEIGGMLELASRGMRSCEVCHDAGPPPKGLVLDGFEQAFEMGDSVVGLTQVKGALGHVPGPSRR